jgi:hypothetical protein
MALRFGPPMTAKNAATPFMRSLPKRYNEQQNEHYEITPHRNAIDQKSRYDSAVITFRE